MKWNAREITLIRTNDLKVIDNKIKILTHHEIINCTAEQIVSVITRVCKESKLLIHVNLRRSNLSFTYSNKGGLSALMT